VNDDMLDFADVTGKRVVRTRLASAIGLHEAHAAASLEAMSRFAANPKWLIYLPPTMSPGKTSKLPSLLEHPSEAFDYFRRQGVGRVVCEEKHMGSRAVAIVCQSQDVACLPTLRRGGRRHRHLLHPHRAAFLQRCRLGDGISRPATRGLRPLRSVDDLGQRLGLPRR
jgi:hypothetical protein